VAAAAADVFASVFFSGRDQSRSETENYKSLAEFLAILEDCSASHPMKILLENWPGFHKNSIATTPEGWRTLFTFVNSTRIGWSLILLTSSFKALKLAPRIPRCRIVSS
jgi:sugar phosphate isomerase/epimerase